MIEVSTVFIVQLIIVVSAISFMAGILSMAFILEIGRSHLSNCLDFNEELKRSIKPIEKIYASRGSELNPIPANEFETVDKNYVHVYFKGGK